MRLSLRIILGNFQFLERYFNLNKTATFICQQIDLRSSRNMQQIPRIYYFIILIITFSTCHINKIIITTRCKT